MQDWIIPLEMIKLVNPVYPDIWSRIEKVREQNIDGNAWDKRCYVPIVNVYDELYKDSNHKKASQYMGIVAALAAWRIHKQIFCFDTDLERLLIDQRDESLILPVETLRNLPYDCIYIKTKILKNVDGFFARYEYWEGKMELSLSMVEVEGTRIDVIPATICLTPGKTINELIHLAFAMDNGDGELVFKNLTAQDKKAAADVMNSLLQLVLYLCSQNSEVVEDTKQKEFRKPPKAFEFIKDKPREIQKWNCGEQTGELIRKYQSNPKQYYEGILKHSGNGTPKSPHARRGHWHSYWTGKRDSDDRKIILKWLAPTFIHKIAEKEAQRTTTNIVEKEKKYEKV